MPHGWRGVWLALTLVITSYMGIEGIAVTAGEARDPAASIPRAMRTMVLRLIVFYVLAIAVMLAMTPWRELGAACARDSERSIRAVMYRLKFALETAAVITTMFIAPAA